MEHLFTAIMKQAEENQIYGHIVDEGKRLFFSLQKRQKAYGHLRQNLS